MCVPVSGLVVSTFANYSPPGVGGSNPASSLEFAWSPHAPGVSSTYSGFPRQSKDMRRRLIGVSKLVIVCECVPCDELEPSTVCPLPCALSSLGKAPGSLATLRRINGAGNICMDGFRVLFTMAWVLKDFFWGNKYTFLINVY